MQKMHKKGGLGYRGFWEFLAVVAGQGVIWNFQFAEHEIAEKLQKRKGTWEDST